MLTVEIRGCHSEMRQAIREIIGDRAPYQNTPYLFVDFEDRERANLAVVKLNCVPGISAHIVGDER